MENTNDVSEHLASTDGYVAMLGALGFAEGNNSDDAEEYYSEQKYRHTDGLGEDDISQDAVTMLKWAKIMSGELKSKDKLLDRALAIINEAIMHGMPVSDEVAAISNAIRGTASAT